MTMVRKRPQSVHVVGRACMILVAALLLSPTPVCAQEPLTPASTPSMFSPALTPNMVPPIFLNTPSDASPAASPTLETPPVVARQEDNNSTVPAPTAATTVQVDPVVEIDPIETASPVEAPAQTPVAVGELPPDTQVGAQQASVTNFFVVSNKVGILPFDMLPEKQERQQLDEAYNMLVSSLLSKLFPDGSPSLNGKAATQEYNLRECPSYLPLEESYICMDVRASFSLTYPDGFDGDIVSITEDARLAVSEAIRGGTLACQLEGISMDTLVSVENGGGCGGVNVPDGTVPEDLNNPADNPAGATPIVDTADQPNQVDTVEVDVVTDAGTDAPERPDFTDFPSLSPSAADIVGDAEGTPVPTARSQFMLTPASTPNMFTPALTPNQIPPIFDIVTPAFTPSQDLVPTVSPTTASPTLAGETEPPVAPVTTAPTPRPTEVSELILTPASTPNMLTPALTPAQVPPIFVAVAPNFTPAQDIELPVPATTAPVTPAPVSTNTEGVPTTAAPIDLPMPTTPAPVTPAPVGAAPISNTEGVPTTAAPVDLPMATTPAPVTPAPVGDAPVSNTEGVPTTAAPIDLSVPTTPAPVTPAPIGAAPVSNTDGVPTTAAPIDNRVPFAVPEASAEQTTSAPNTPFPVTEAPAPTTREIAPIFSPVYEPPTPVPTDRADFVLTPNSTPNMVTPNMTPNQIPPVLRERSPAFTPSQVEEMRPVDAGDETPTASPTSTPTVIPTMLPSVEPSPAPTLTERPTVDGMGVPSAVPSFEPSPAPTNDPTGVDDEELAPVTLVPVTLAPVNKGPTGPVAAPVVSVGTVTGAPVTPSPVATGPMAPTAEEGPVASAAPVVDDDEEVTNAPVTPSPVGPVAPVSPIFNDRELTEAPVTPSPVTTGPVAAPVVDVGELTEAPVTPSPVATGPVAPTAEEGPVVSSAPIVDDGEVTNAPVTPSPVSVEEATVTPSESFLPSVSPSMSAAPSVAELGSIAGNVKEDTNNNDIGDDDLSGVLITMLDDSNGVVATTLTDANGNYGFNGVSPGQYTVMEMNLAGYLDVSDSDGDNPNEISVEITTGLDSTGNDFVDEPGGPVAPVAASPSGSSLPSVSPLPTSVGAPSIPLAQEADATNAPSGSSMPSASAMPSFDRPVAISSAPVIPLAQDQDETSSPTGVRDIDLSPVVGAPTAPLVPDAECSDNEMLVFWVASEGQTRGCSWLRELEVVPEELCAAQGVPHYLCPAACGTCANVTEIYKEQFNEIVEGV